MDPMALLEQGLARLGLRPSARQLSRLRAFLDELERWNRRYGFVKVRAAEDLVVRHLLDSLSGLPAIASVLGQIARGGGEGSVARLAEPVARLADVGSGAGFPGIPLAVFLEETEVTLLERSAKKAAFLRNLVILLELGRVEVLEGELGRLELPGPGFDAVTFRALQPLDRGLERLLAMLRPGGTLVAYKGKRARLEKELAGLDLEAAELSVLPLRVPFLAEERNLVLIRPKPR